MSETVSLSADDFGLCLHLASDRTVESLRANRKDAIFDKDHIAAFNVHLLGAIGEVAFAKWLGVYPSWSCRQFKGMAADVGDRYEIRHRASKAHDLILRGGEPVDRVYVLTRGVPPEPIEVSGWTTGTEHRRDEFLMDYGSHGEAWFVPASQLHPAGMLREVGEVRLAA